MGCNNVTQVSTLKKQLKLQKAHLEKGSIIGDGVSKAFLAAMVSLIGGYRNAMRFHDGADITFDPDIFVTGSSISRDPSSHVEYRRFFEMVLHMQSFQQFISDRLDIMNAGKGGFEVEFPIGCVLVSLYDYLCVVIFMLFVFMLFIFMLFIFMLFEQEAITRFHKMLFLSW